MVGGCSSPREPAAEAWPRVAAWSALPGRPLWLDQRAHPELRPALGPQPMASYWETATTSIPYSYWDTADVGLTTDAWRGFPKLPVSKQQPRLFPRGNTELAFNFPSFVASPAVIRGNAKAGGPPSPLQLIPRALGSQVLRQRIIATRVNATRKLTHRRARLCRC